jgi:hypothetical protein
MAELVRLAASLGMIHTARTPQPDGGTGATPAPAPNEGE